VGSRRDTFIDFIDAMAAGFDEPADGDRFAARVHLSRAQFDRVVTAAAGESPGRLRRRVLLERAAYRLLDGTAGILQVAVEAGYGSNEAFTRAFTRAYGRSPSAWRSEPSSIHLSAPNRVHFFPPGGLRLPSRNEVTSMDLVLTMTEHHIWLLGRMIDRAGAIEEGRLDAPIELSVEGIDADPTLRSLAVPPRRSDGDLEPRGGEPTVRLRSKEGREHRVHECQAGAQWTGVPRSRPRFV